MGGRAWKATGAVLFPSTVTSATFLLCFFSTTNRPLRFFLFVLLRLALPLKMLFYQVGDRQY